MRLRNTASTQCMHTCGLYKPRAAMGPQLLHMPAFEAATFMHPSVHTPYRSTLTNYSVDATQPLRKAVLTNLTTPKPLCTRHRTAFVRHSFGTRQLLQTTAVTQPCCVQILRLSYIPGDSLPFVFPCLKCNNLVGLLLVLCFSFLVRPGCSLTRCCRDQHFRAPTAPASGNIQRDLLRDFRPTLRR